MVGKYNKKGGSKASDNVMATNPKLCDDPVSPVIEGPKMDFKVEDLTLYKTTGGGIKRNLKKKSNKKNLKNKKRNYKKGKKSKNSKKSQKRRYNKRGGSKAYNNVSGLRGQPCNQTNYVNYPTMRSSDLRGYATTGGGLTQDAGIYNNCRPQNFVGGGSSDWVGTLYSRGPVNNPTMDQVQFRMFNQNSPYITNEQLFNAHPNMNGGYKKKNKKGKKSKSKNKKNTKNTKNLKQRGSGSSDWRSTLYSRGPINNPNMDPQQFRMFSQHGQYIPNDSLRTASFMQ